VNDLTFFLWVWAACFALYDAFAWVTL